MRLDEVHREVGDFIEERYDHRRPVDGTSLFESDLGLSSLDVAALVARLQEKLGGSAGEPVAPTDLRTVGDLCTALGIGDGAAADDPLAGARARAAARRGSRGS